MKRHASNGLDRYGVEHLVAFKAYLLLREFGVERALASAAVDSSFDEITAILTEPGREGQDCSVGMRLWIHPDIKSTELIIPEYLGPTATRPSGEGWTILGELSVRLRAVMGTLRDTPEKQS